MLSKIVKLRAMDRRDFLKTTSRAAASLPFLHLPHLADARKMGIVVHSYAHRWNSKSQSKNYPAFNNAIDLLEHCHEIGAGGIQVMVRDWGQDFAKKMRDRREQLGMYLEGSISLPKTKADVAAFERDVIAAREAGADIARTVCLSGRRYETFQSLEAFEDFRTRSLASPNLSCGSTK
jgi:hypothetical protein